MRGEVARLLALATVAAAAAPKQAGKPGWHFKHESPPGWPQPSVYTPPMPENPYGHPYPYDHYTEFGYHTSFPVPYPTATATTTASVSSATTLGTGACASVSKLAASFTSASPSATPTVPADLAYECINSVPFNQSAAEALLESIRPYLNWQTTIEYLADPPAEYAAKVQGPYDFFADYNGIEANVKAGTYSNEYEFGFDLYEAFQKAHDGHFVVYPDSVTMIFSFGRNTPLVSVSVDGTSIPEVYAYSDVLQASYENSTFIPSPLRMIDGQDSTEWLLNYSQYGSLQDKDALWNNMFYLLGQVSLGPSGTGAGTFVGGGRGRWIYPGPTTSLTFANGTTLVMENFARVLVPFDNITTGEDIYREFFTPPTEVVLPVEVLATMTTPSSSAMASTSSAVASTSSSTSIPAPGYPSPIVREMNNLNSGYFLAGEDYSDVAVLSVPSFVSSGADEIPFQSVNTYTINRAVAANKTKLIIDVSANGGGTILQGYDLFQQLFPDILPYGATRLRAHEALNLIGQEFSAFAGMVPRSLDTNLTVESLVSAVFNYRTDANITYNPFTSWAEKFGPHAYGPEPDNFTSIIRWNLSDPLTPLNSGGIDISGYGNRTNITMRPFEAENIVIVYDGYCASTCTIFSELMRQQAGIKTIALGGRPNRDQIQAVGGVKGTNDYPFSYILQAAEVPFIYQYIHDEAYYNASVLADYGTLPLYRTTASVVNARDGIREGDVEQVPLQFVYEEADCRVYYTPEMAVSQEAAWQTVADVAFRGTRGCVAGSLPGGGNGSGNGTAGGYRKRDVGRARKMRRSLDLSGLYEAMSEVWTGRGGVTVDGDGFMVL